MNILHITCGMSYTNVYKNLFNTLNDYKLNFEVYIPQHSLELVEQENRKAHCFPNYSGYAIKPYDKILYFTKIQRMVKDIERNFDLTSVNILHAHSLFSDGGVAYEIKKKYNIPFVVAIRDTDINKYLKLAIHLRHRALKILKSAEKVIFLGPAYKELVINKFKKNKQLIINKSEIIPNGIDSYWHKNKPSQVYENNHNKFTILYVGQITRRKNILKLIEATNFLVNNYKIKIQLNIIGEINDRKYFKKLQKKADFNYIPKIPKEELKEFYRKADVFVMPSFTESFGLVYAEALSQGLPIIYTKNQGFDKQFHDGEVGFSVDPNNEKEIATKILMSIKNKKLMGENGIKNTTRFCWSKIAERYIEIYKECLYR